MNERARKQARRAELEYVLTDVWNSERISFDFADWLEVEAVGKYGRAEEAKELIALYEEGL